MREIRFRAWHGDSYEMFYPSEIHWDDNENITTVESDHALQYDHQEGGLWTFNIKDINLMQYTGLKDKNGVEIYEGDIVNVTTNHIADLVPDNPKTTSTVEVKFERAMFMFGDMTLNYFPLREAEFEVIGNIYQNGDLLE